MSGEFKSVRFSVRRLLAVIVAIAVCGTLYVMTIGQSPIARLFGGGANLATARDATRVEAYRLAAPPATESPEEYRSPLEYRVVSGPVSVSAETSQELSQAIVSSGTYAWEMAKACGAPVYAVKLSFFKDSQRVDVYLCFQCDVLAVAGGDTVFGFEDFDYSRKLLVRTVKELFPGDAAIQAIEE